MGGVSTGRGFTGCGWWCNSGKTIMNNPWGEDDIVLGDINCALSLATRHGIGILRLPVTKSSLPVKSKSLRFIAVLQELSNLREALHKVEYDILCYKLDKDSKDFVHFNILDSRHAQLESLTKYFSEVVQSTEKLVVQLQTVSIESSVKIEAHYHQCFHELMTVLTQLLNNLPEYCKGIDWLKQVQSEHDPFKLSSLSFIVQRLVDCKLAAQRLKEHVQSRN